MQVLSQPEILQIMWGTQWLLNKHLLRERMERAVYTGRSGPAGWGRFIQHALSPIVCQPWVEPGMPLGASRDLGLSSWSNDPVQKI